MADDIKGTPEKKLGGVPQSEYVKIAVGALVGLLVGILVTLIGNWWTSKAPYLRYTPADTVTFQGDTNRFGIISCVVTNDGSKEAEEVALSFDLADSPFVEVKVTPDSLQPEVKYENEPVVPVIGLYHPKKAPPPPAKKGNHARIAIKLLNPGESFQVLAMASNPESLPKRPAFTVRGKGVVGQLAARRERPTWFWILDWFEVLCLGIMLAFATSILFRIVRRDPRLFQEKH